MRQFRGVARGRKSGLKFGAREEAEGTKIKLMGDWIKERNGEVKPTANSGLPLPHHGKEHSNNSIAATKNSLKPIRGRLTLAGKPRPLIR